MLIGYGYGYPRSMVMGKTPAELAWAAFNARADADPTGAALPAEASVSGCLFGRFSVIFNF